MMARAAGGAEVEWLPMSRLLACFWLVSLAASAQYRRGVNISGAEFGMNTLPGLLGREYTFNSEGTFRYFSEKKLGLMRVPLQWERLQPVPGGPLDSDYLSNVKRDVAWAKAHGGEVILDIHNFARYSFTGKASQSEIIDNPSSDGSVKLTTAHLADLWVRLSNEFKFEPAVYAYDLMNEPHDMGRGNWKSISQAALSAIRGNQDDKLVLIPGDSWSSGNRWMTTHGPTGWIQDPSNNFAYEAHQYFDRDESGTYAQTYDAELRSNTDLANVGRTRISHFIDWCAANNVRGIVDEYGIPAGDDRWAAVLENFFTSLDAAGMDGAYWAAGEWWGTYALSVQPTANFTVDRPQMATLLAHAPGGYLTALSSASVSVARGTGGSFVSLYGSGFAESPAQADSVVYPTELGGVSVEVRDSGGATAQAGLLYVSANQINLRLPALLGAGRAKLTVSRNGAPVASGSIAVSANAPSIFTVNSAGYGLAAAQVIRIKADGTQTYEPVVQLDADQNLVPLQVDFGPVTDRLFLALYGTGIRGNAATVRVGGVDVVAAYAGPQGQYPGLDQVNAELPRSLVGSGVVNVTLLAAGVAANTVTIALK